MLGAVEHLGAVRLGEDRLAQILADLARIDVIGRHEIEVADLVSADILVDQAVCGVGSCIMVLALTRLLAQLPTPMMATLIVLIDPHLPVVTGERHFNCREAR
ncbi:hypothetical protein AB5I41_26100 [Sphingomonas sp. MMS24-JH45]